MNAKRKKVTEFILEQVQKITPGSTVNRDLLEKRLNGLTDAEFEDYIRRLKPAETPEEISQRECIPLYIPNLSKDRISIARNYQIARELGRSLAHRLIMTDPSTGTRYVTPHEYPVYDLNVRRQAQTVVKKRSIPEHNQREDDLTGQPTSMSKGSRISDAELAALNSRGFDNTILEFIKVRGGDSAAYREMKRQLIERGSCSYKDVAGLGRVKSSQTLSSFLNGMHIGNNINPDTKVPEDALRR